MVQIMSDSSALYSIAQGKEVGLVVNPLSVSVADKTYREFEEIDSDTFLKLVIEGNTPSSSQPSVGETLSLYEQYGDAPLLNITVADGLSGTYQTASAAAQNMPEEKRKNITVINSGTLCGPHRYLVQKALSLAKEGLSTEEILNALAPSLGNHRSFLIPNDFDFLRRGGRLTPLAAKVGGLLKLVPVMTTTKDGNRLEKFALCRSFASAMETICKNFLENKVGPEHYITVSHAGAPALARQALEKLRAVFPDSQIDVLNLSPAFITQGGPQCVAIQYILK